MVERTMLHLGENPKTQLLPKLLDYVYLYGEIKLNIKQCFALSVLFSYYTAYQNIIIEL